MIATADDLGALKAPEVSSSGGRTTPVGFEPTRAEPNGYLVHLLNHSDTVSRFEADGSLKWAWELSWVGVSRKPGGRPEVQADAPRLRPPRKLNGVLNDVHGRYSSVVERALRKRTVVGSIPTGGSAFLWGTRIQFCRWAAIVVVPKEQGPNP